MNPSCITLASRLFLLTASLLFVCSTSAQTGFTKITDPANPIVTFTSLGVYKGAAWVDYDVDGDIDLFAAPRYLFRNDGGDVFTQITTAIGTAPQQQVGGCSWGDWDNDGDPDMLLAQYPSGVFRNDGGGTFTDITALYDSLINWASWAGALGNLGDDQELDFLFAHAAGFHPVAAPVTPSRLYSTTNPDLQGLVQGIEITDTLGPYTVPFWSDYDQDGDMDIFMASGPGGSPGPDFCYRNMLAETGTADLVRMTTEQFSVDLQDGQCYNFIDYDNDRDLDLMLTNYGGAPSRLYVNVSGVYSVVPGFTNLGNYLANDWGDFDNDGDLDVILSLQGAGTIYYRNNAGTFELVPNALLTGPSTCGIVNGDYDNDGDLDVFAHGTNAAKSLFRNDTVAPAGNHWINIALTGVQSNRSAIGAHVSIKAFINGVPTWQLREINAQNSFQGHNDLRVHFGLGDAATIDSVVVRWPAGLVQSFTQVGANDFYFLTEDGELATSIVPSELPNASFTLLSDLVHKQITLMGNITEAGSRWSVIDAQGRVVRDGRIFGERTVIDVAALTPGAYVIAVNGHTLGASAKFIVPR